jgi:hypothetical protein
MADLENKNQQHEQAQKLENPKHPFGNRFFKTTFQLISIKLWQIFRIKKNQIRINIGIIAPIESIEKPLDGA